MNLECKQVYVPVGDGCRGCKQMDGWPDVHMDGEWRVRQ